MAHTPRIATAIASTHMRMRVQSPMLTMSETAPIVQKLVLLPTNPKTPPSAKPSQAISAAEGNAVSISSPFPLRRPAVRDALSGRMFVSGYAPVYTPIGYPASRQLRSVPPMRSQ